MGTDTKVYLASAEVAAISAALGKIPTKAEYMERMKVVTARAADIYRYMNFDKMPEYAG
jgi:aconitate hydratase 2/2-methylisocitrate dehydratase